MGNTIPSASLVKLGFVVSECLRESAGILGVVQKDVKNIPSGLSKTIDIGYSVPVATADVTPAIVPAAFPADVAWKSKSVTLTSWKKASFYLTSDEMDMINRGAGGYIPDQITQCVRAITNVIRTSCYTACKKFNGYVKTSQTSIINSTDGTGNLVDARKILNKMLCPRAGRVLMLCADEEANALKSSQFIEAAKSGDQSNPAFREGFMGRVAGFETHAEDTTDIPYAHTAGTGSGYVLDGNHAAGATTITVKTGANTLLQYDNVKIGNHYYTLKTALSGATFTIEEPGLLEAVADGGTVTLAATHDVQGYAFQPKGIVLAMRTPFVEGSLGQHQMVMDPVSGLMVKLVRLPAYEALVYEVQALWVADIAQPSLGARVCSA